ncbi:TPA: succinyl-CoA--3-ketoacid-CoA transferase [Candidatus Gastranaerophilales bacterium HUM_9]|nr:MAG TPA: succinyl-CoA--3-ketoacid-CoA transferase [Candidatus Gastranaerophilales bacterium HUM_9]HBX34160.1 succinyl-CoA--3-ketoacid-CoA transferase [Cyanobacteria bacterium UBA11440]
MIETKELTKEKIREIIAKRTAKEFKRGDVVTLGIGLPTEVANYVPEDMHVMFQSENGFLGVSKNATEETKDEKIINAGGICVEAREGACFYDSQMAFTMMRGGHIDATVLGALQVDQDGSIASWLIPNKFAPGMGGAMDLVVGSKKVIVAMEHTAKGKVKIVKKCDLPLTAYKEVNVIITERCVFNVTEDGLLLAEINPMFTIDDIKNSVTAEFEVADDLKYMEV